MFGKFMSLFGGPVKVNGTQDHIERIDKALHNGKDVEVTRPTSYRYYSKGGPRDTYLEGKVTISPQPDAKKVGKPSTCVASTQYNPYTGTCGVKFVGNSKTYDYRMTPDEFKKFMESESKGRYVNEVMKYQNRMPGY